MRYLSQTEAHKEREYFSKKRKGAFVLTSNRDESFYPPQFMITGFDTFDSGILGLTRDKHTTHVKLRISGPPHVSVAVKFIKGHYEKRKLLQDYSYIVSTGENGEVEENVRIHRKDYGIIFILDTPTSESQYSNDPEIRVEGDFEFVEIKRFMLFSRILNRIF
jgi:hypothetical protein